MSQIETYKERVQKLLNLFNEQDPDWIQRRTWTNALLDFELGQDFFIRFFIKYDDDLTSLQTYIITAWADAIVDQKQYEDDAELLKATSDALSQTCLLGTEIDPEYLNTPRVEIVYQQKCLDYAWWIIIKELIYAQTSEQYKKRLDKKAETFLEQI